MRGYKIVIVVLFLLFAVFAYNSIVYLGFLNGNNSWVAYSVALSTVIGIGICLINKTSVDYSTKFWMLWVFWQILLFFILLRGTRNVFIFNALYAPISFLTFYTICKKSETMFRYCCICGISFFFITTVYTLYAMYNGVTYAVQGHTAASGLCFWPLSLSPFIAMINKKWIKYAGMFLLAYAIIISAKRSAFICLILISSVFCYYNFLSASKNKILTVILLLLSFSLLFSIISHYMGESWIFMMNRMDNISEDQGSGRINIFAFTLERIKQFDLFDFLFGRGCFSFQYTGVSNAHNDILQMMYEYGIVGLFFYIALTIRTIKTTRYCYYMESSIFMGYFFSLIIFIVLGAVSNLVPSLTYFSFITAFWGCVEGNNNRILEEE